MKKIFQESSDPRAYWLLMIVILLFGVGLRFFGLAEAPMTAAEASNANAALASIRSDFSSRTVEPFYGFLTSIVFKLFGDSSFTARLVPFLFGIALIFLPFAFRNYFSSPTILIWTLLMALDPSLIAWSKRADGAIITVCLMAYLIVALRNRSIPSVVIFSAALIASPLRSLPMMIAAALVAAGIGFMSAILFDGNFRPMNRVRELYGGKVILASCGLAFVFASAFFANPSGAGAIGSGILDAFSGASILIPPSAWLVVAFVFYGFQSILAIGSRIEGERERSALKILLPTAVLIVVLIAALFNQGVLAFVWSAPILTLCAAVTAESLLNRINRPFVFVEKIYFFVPSAFLMISCLTLSAFTRFANQSASLTAAVTIGNLTLPFTQAQQFFFLALTILTAVYFLIPMVVSHFSETSLGKAGAAGILFAALIVLGGNAWDAAGFHHQSDTPATMNVAAQPLLGNPSYFDATVLKPELSALSVKTGRSETEAGGIIVARDGDAALRWTLRDYPNAVFSPFLIRENVSQPDFYLTADQPAELLAAYSGMEIAASRTIQYASLNDLHWLNWLLNRKLPTREEILILWQKNGALYAN